MTQNNYLPGEVVTGKVTKLEKDCAWIDIGLAKLAYLHISEIWNRPNYKINCQDILFINQIRDFEIVPDYNRSGFICLSMRKIQHKIIAKRLEQIHQENVTIYANVYRIVNAGVIVELEELLSGVSPFLLGHDLNLEEIIGKLLPVKIFNLNISENYCNFTLIHDCLEVRNRIEQFSVGKIVSCQIRCIKKYGIIVNINNDNDFKLTGLIHIDNISSHPTDNLNSLFKIGQIVKAVIIEVDAKIQRFSLSIKLLEL